MFKAKTASVKGDNDWPFWIITDGGSLNISNKVVRKLIESNKLEPTETLMDWVLNGGVLLSREKAEEYAELANSLETTSSASETNFAIELELAMKKISGLEETIKLLEEQVRAGNKRL